MIPRNNSKESQADIYYGESTLYPGKSLNQGLEGVSLGIMVNANGRGPRLLNMPPARTAVGSPFMLHDMLPSHPEEVLEKTVSDVIKEDISLLPTFSWSSFVNPGDPPPPSVQDVQALRLLRVLPASEDVCLLSVRDPCSGMISGFQQTLGVNNTATGLSSDTSPVAPEDDDSVFLALLEEDNDLLDRVHKALSCSSRVVDSSSHPLSTPSSSTLLWSSALSPEMLESAHQDQQRTPRTTTASVPDQDLDSLNDSVRAGESLEPLSSRDRGLSESKQSSDISVFEDLNSNLLDTSTLTSDTTHNYAREIPLRKEVPEFEMIRDKLCFQYPFELDIFQKEAILCLEKHESVFVAAHTSAGKTVVAEYAIALAHRHCTRVIYTSPIKALSNQKYREFKRNFSSIGLLTGDTQVNPNATCVIMTTEILRSMLYRGSSEVKDVEWVVFDEVHYINDAKRGVVWEEVLILLPEHINLIMLSATVPNCVELAEWIGSTKRQMIHVIVTNKRPVPLEHFVYVMADRPKVDSLHPIVNKQGEFVHASCDGAARAFSELFGDQEEMRLDAHKEAEYLRRLLTTLKENSALPIILFVFSKTRCDQLASKLSSLNLLSSFEMVQVNTFFSKAIDRLSADDRNIRQVRMIQNMIQRGFAVHHSGVLPLLKEIAEILFQRGLIKVLIATETFSMGVNMPAKTVVFTQVKKFDGESLRYLLAGEYTQMAGRAGRRGLDPTGMVIIMAKEKPSSHALEALILGRPQKLESRFRLTYTMILNLTRTDRFSVEEVMKCSFGEYDPTLSELELLSLEKTVSSLPSLECNICRPLISQYVITLDEFHNIRHLFLDRVVNAMDLTAGRVVVVYTPKFDMVPGIILRKSDRQPGNTPWLLSAFAVMLLMSSDKCIGDGTEGCLYVNDARSSVPDLRCYGPFRTLQLGRWKNAKQAVMADISIVDMWMISSLKIKVDAQSIYNDFRSRNLKSLGVSKKTPGFDQSVEKAIHELVRVLKSGKLVDLFQPGPGQGYSMETFQLTKRLSDLKQILQDCPINACPSFAEHLSMEMSRTCLNKELDSMKKRHSFEGMDLFPDYKHRLLVLQKMGYVRPDGKVLLRGRCACDIGCGEMVITELIFQDLTRSWTPEELAAALSCFVLEEKRQQSSSSGLPANLEKILQVVRMVATSIAYLEKESGILEDVVDPEEIRDGAMQFVYNWACGMGFSAAYSSTQISEGIVVRCVQRLEELLRDVQTAAKVVLDDELYLKATRARDLIKRDIAFTSSLYLDGSYY